MTRTEIKEIVTKILQKTNKFEDVFTKADSIFTTQIDIKPILARLKESKRKYLKYPVEIQSNFKPKSYKLELVAILQMIRNGDFKSDQELLERLIKENNLMPKVFFENRKRYTPCGIFYHKASVFGIRILNQVLLLEAMKLTLKETDIQKIKNDEYTFAFYRQIFPEQYFLLVKTTNLNSRNYVEFQEIVETYYSKLLGSTKIRAMNLNVSIPFSYDAELYHNSHSIPFTK